MQTTKCGGFPWVPINKMGSHSKSAISCQCLASAALDPLAAHYARRPRAGQPGAAAAVAAPSHAVQRLLLVYSSRSKKISDASIADAHPCFDWLAKLESRNH